MHKYYEKECCNNFVIGDKSAMAESARRTTLVQEGLRRMLNTSRDFEPAVWSEIMEDFVVKMYRSGYNRRFRSQVVHGSLAAYQCRLRQADEGSRPLFRPREYRREEREEAKLLKEGSWFKKGSEQEAKAVIFVTATPASELARSITRRLREAKVPVRVAEKSGPKISQLLVKTDPFHQDVCDRANCLVCTTRDPSAKGRSNCHKEGVTYSLECQQEGCGGIYIGESATTAFVRGSEHSYQYGLHKRGLEGGRKSVCGRHVVEKHQGDHSVSFSMSVLSHYLGETHQRQVDESTRIDCTEEDRLINTRGERGSDLIRATGTIARSKPASGPQNTARR